MPVGPPEPRPVLVVIRDPGLRAAVATAVRGAGHDVTAMPTAEDARQWLADGATPDVVLADLGDLGSAALLAAARSGDQSLAYGDLVLDRADGTVRRGGEVVALTPTESAVLRHLLLNAGRVVTKSEVLEAVWEYDFRGRTNVVELYVGYLRRKLGHTERPFLHTVRGFGYVLRVDA